MQAMCCDAQQNAGSVQQCVGSGPVENMMALCGDTFVHCPAHFARSGRSILKSVLHSACHEILVSISCPCIALLLVSCVSLPEASKIIVLAIWGNFATSIILESSVPLHMQTVSKAPASFQNSLTETTFLQLPGCKVPLGCKVHLPVVKCTFWL